MKDIIATDIVKVPSSTEAFSCEHTAHASPRVQNISLITGYQVHMNVHPGLAACFPDVYTDVVPIWCMLFIHGRLRLI